MDKIAAEIFAPLLAGMAGKQPEVNFTAHREILTDADFCTIRVPLCEVEYTDDDPRDPDAHWYMGTLTEVQTQRVYKLLLEDADVCNILDRLAEQVAREVEDL